VPRYDADDASGEGVECQPAFFAARFTAIDWLNLNSEILLRFCCRSVVAVGRAGYAQSPPVTPPSDNAPRSEIKSTGQLRQRNLAVTEPFSLYRYVPPTADWARGKPRPPKHRGPAFCVALGN